MIYLIITSCIYNKYGIVDEYVRKSRYIECIRSTLLYLPQHIVPIIVENSCDNKSSTFSGSYLEEFSNRCSILYTRSNIVLETPHKGVNELYDIHEVIRAYGIQDDDMIIKLTGRYQPLNCNFFNRVVEEVEQYDAFVKFFNVCTETFMYDDCALGLLAIRCRYWKHFLYPCERSPEVEIATMVRNRIEPSRICELQTVGLRCCFADDLRVLDI
jgi:hypothetical protein